ncbi:hypothetical protein, partial [uncultured Gimesia sp.]|uniref:hypothetical protein n=1 Tax=uncultured Gimesia sp. TaxID=1678688 RepID=UPI0026187E49
GYGANYVPKRGKSSGKCGNKYRLFQDMHTIQSDEISQFLARKSKNLILPTFEIDVDITTYNH